MEVNVWDFKVFIFIYIYSVVSSTFCETVVHDDDDDDVEISITYYFT